MSNLFNNFSRGKKPLPKIVRMYEPEEESNIERYKSFPVFVGIGALVVFIIVFAIIYFNSSNNVLKSFVDASSKNFDCSSFSYNVSTKLNGVSQMEYEGDIEFDLNGQILKSVYSADYTEYTYDTVVHCESTQSYRGNYYDGKWIVDSYSDKALDFFDFYRDYRKHEFDAGAALRFTGLNSTFSAQGFDASFDDIVNELTKPKNIDSVLCVQTVTSDKGTTVTMTPQLEQVFDIIVDEIGSAYLSANEYTQFLQTVENSRDNLHSAEAVISYTITADGYLSDILVNYTIGNDTYEINIEMSDFGVAQVDVPDSFYEAAGIE